jgi:predicted O-methyltransferase YrrM
LQDPFVSIRDATNAHRAKHAGCGAFPYGNGALLGALAAATNARRILELGTGLGYSALWFAHGAPDAVIDTVERDARHVKLARAHVTQFNLDGHIVVHQSDFAKVLPRLDPGYDIVFFDGFAPTPKILKLITALLKTRGLLISANQTIAGKDTEAWRAAILDPENWLTAFIGPEQETALSVKL